MKKQFPIIKILIHAAVVLFATAVVSTSRAEGAMAFGDFNNDGFEDVAEITSPTTVTVYLQILDGIYTVSAILSVPKNHKIGYVDLVDIDADGDLDVYATAYDGPGRFYIHSWLGNGDGTFGSRMTYKPRGRGIGW